MVRAIFRFFVFTGGGYVYGFLMFNVLHTLLNSLGLLSIYKILLLLAIIIPVFLVLIVFISVWDVICIYFGIVLSYLYFVSETFRKLFE